MKFKNRPNKHHLIDGRVVWESRSCTVCSVVEATVDGQRYIALGCRGPKTPDPEYRGKFGLACGYIDWDENALEAATREIWEELGLDVSGEGWSYERQPWHVNSSPAPPNHRQNITLRYYFQFVGEELPKLSAANAEEGEVDILRWVPLEEAMDMDLAFRHSSVLKEKYKCS